MSSVIGSLRVNLGLDSANFESGARRVQSPLKAMKAQFVAASAVALALGTAISAFAIKGANDIDRAAKASRRLGTSIGGFRALELAAGEAGVSLSSLTNDVQTMDREIAKGSKGAAESLKKLGISAGDLAGLEADQKIALIADQIQKLGLDAGQASVVLQGLGVRNREMVLAVLGGGEAFRQARKDAEDYGLAVSKVDSAAIEQANDRIGRLGLIGQYAAQQLAIALVPTMGALAQVMTDSLREGGLLRTMIDGLVGNIDTLAASVGVLVAFLGIKLVAAMAVSLGATSLLTGAFVLLRAAIIKTGFGALIVGAGFLVAKFGDLVKGAGGFGEALGLLRNVASAVFADVDILALALLFSMEGIVNKMVAAFLNGFATISDKFGDMIADFLFASPILEAIGIDIGAMFKGMGGKAAAGIRAAADEFSVAASSSLKNASDTMKGATATNAALAELKAGMSGIKDETGDAADEAERLALSLNNLGNGGAGTGGGAGGAVDGLKDKVESLKETANEMKDTFRDAFKGLITGAKSFGEVVGNVLNTIADKLLDSAFDALWGGSGGGGGGLGGFVGNLFGGLFGSAKGNVFSGGSAVTAFANGGIVNGPTLFPMKGSQTGLMGEAGPEAIMPLSRGKNGKLGVQTGVGGGATLQIIAPEGFSVQQRGEIQGIAVQITSEGISGYDRNTLPKSVDRISKDPRRIG